MGRLCFYQAWTAALDNTRMPPTPGSRRMPWIVTLLILGRVSNLPTVWSNCLAGWWLGGRGHIGRLPALFAGTTLLYVGGMFLNDAFDVEFDRQYRKERPIPSGAISVRTVWTLGYVFFGVGSLCLILNGLQTSLLAFALLLTILLYDALHKTLTWAPLLMAGCRFLLYPIAASYGIAGINRWVIIGASALAAYVFGVTMLARVESKPGAIRYWPIATFGVPILAALTHNLDASLLLCVVFALWVARALRPALWTAEKNVGFTVSWLLAGIVLVDWLAVADESRALGLVFIGLFLTSLLLQRVVPAT